MKFLITASFAALFFSIGCASGPESTRSATADESLDTLAQTSKSITLTLRTIDENIANAHTIAYKSRRVFFQPAPAPVIRVDFEQGSMESTARPLDVGIQGSGFFAVKLPATAGNGIGYTRMGNFFRNRNGDLRLGAGEGYEPIPQITIPPLIPDDNIHIGQDGKVEYIIPGTSTRCAAGQLQVAQFPNLQGVKWIDELIFIQTDDSGSPVVGNPMDNSTGSTLSGFLEASNVSVAREELRRVEAERWQAAIDRTIARVTR